MYDLEGSHLLTPREGRPFIYDQIRDRKMLDFWHSNLVANVGKWADIRMAWVCLEAFLVHYRNLVEVTERTSRFTLMDYSFGRGGCAMRHLHYGPRYATFERGCA